MGAPLWRMPPCSPCLRGLVWRETTLTFSTTTAAALGRTSGPCPACPCPYRTGRPQVVLLDAHFIHAHYPPYSAEAQGRDLHIILVAQLASLTRPRPRVQEDLSILDEDGGVVVEPVVKAVGLALRRGMRTITALADLALLPGSAGLGLADRSPTSPCCRTCGWSRPARRWS